MIISPLVTVIWVIGTDIFGEVHSGGDLRFSHFSKLRSTEKNIWIWAGTVLKYILKYK